MSCPECDSLCGDSVVGLLDPDVGFVFQVCPVGGPETVDADVEAMAVRVLAAAKILRTTRVIIGSTYADLLEPGAVVPENITKRGLAGRWRQTYEERGFTGLLVVALVSDDDVTGCLEAYRMMPLELARLYERLLDEAIPEPLDHSREIAGGGRLGTTRREVGVVYAALGP